MIMTSFYFSIGGILALGLYGITGMQGQKSGRRDGYGKRISR